MSFPVSGSISARSPRGLSQEEVAVFHPCRAPVEAKQLVLEVRTLGGKPLATLDLLVPSGFVLGSVREVLCVITLRFLGFRVLLLFVEEDGKPLKLVHRLIHGGGEDRLLSHVSRVVDSTRKRVRLVDVLDAVVLGVTRTITRPHPSQRAQHRYSWEDQRLSCPGRCHRQTKHRHSRSPPKRPHRRQDRKRRVDRRPV